MSEPLRVLYVDDDAHALELRKEQLEEMGEFDVIIETTVKAALDRLKAEGEAIDCLLSDLNMPGTDGMEFLETVREEAPELPFVVFTGEDSADAVDEVIDGGATDYVPKSSAAISYRVLANRIERAVEHADATNGQAESAEKQPHDQEVEPDGKADETAAASITEALGGTSSGEQAQQEHTCPIPGCDFTAMNEERILEHIEETVGDRTAAGALHRRHNPDSRRTRPTVASVRSRERTRPNRRRSTDRSSHKSKTTLEDLPESELYALARALGIRGRSRLDRDELVTEIRREMDEPDGEPADDPTEAQMPSGGFWPQVPPWWMGPQQMQPPEHTIDQDSAEVSSLSEEQLAELAEKLSTYLSNNDGGDNGVDRADTGHHPDSKLHRSEPSTHAAESLDTWTPDREDDRRRKPFSLSIDLPGKESGSTEAAEGDPSEGNGKDTDETEDEKSPGVPELPTEPGTSTLIEWPADDETRDQLCHRHLQTQADTPVHVLLVRYRKLPGDRLEQIASHAERVTIITVNHTQRVPEEISDRVETISIDKPTDIQRLGILVTRTVEDWAETDAAVHVCLDSLNVLLRYCDVQRAFRFLHLLLGKLDATDALAHVHLDPSTEETRDVSIIRTLFDNVIERSAGEIAIDQGDGASGSATVES